MLALLRVTRHTMFVNSFAQPFETLEYQGGAIICWLVNSSYSSLVRQFVFAGVNTGLCVAVSLIMRKYNLNMSQLCFC